MPGQAGFWDIDERYVRLSEAGDPLKKLNALVPWEVFRKPLAKALKRSDGVRGGRPPTESGFAMIQNLGRRLCRACFSGSSGCCRSNGSFEGSG